MKHPKRSMDYYKHIPKYTAGDIKDAVAIPFFIYGLFLSYNIQPKYFISLVRYGLIFGLFLDFAFTFCRVNHCVLRDPKYDGDILIKYYVLFNIVLAIFVYYLYDKLK